MSINTPPQPGLPEIAAIKAHAEAHPIASGRSGLWIVRAPNDLPRYVTMPADITEDHWKLTEYADCTWIPCTPDGIPTTTPAERTPSRAEVAREFIQAVNELRDSRFVDATEAMQRVLKQWEDD